MVKLPKNKEKKCKMYSFASKSGIIKSMIKKEPTSKHLSNREKFVGLHRVDLDKKKQFIATIKQIVDIGCVIGKDLVVGINSVSRMLETRNISVICIAKDSNPASIHDDIIAAAKIKKVPVVIFSKLCKELGTTLKIKRASCLAVPEAIASTSDAIDTSSNKESRDNEMLGARLDQLREYLLTLSSNNSL